MKIKTILVCLSLLLFFSGNTYAQNIEWAVQDTTSYYFKKLVCDKDSNLYVYGSNLGADGSYLEKLSTNGNNIFTKNWPDSFFIRKLIYDGNQYFYFAGYFADTLTVDGITLTAKGGYDGMAGQMNSSGTILWISTISSAEEELANWLCFGPGKNSIIVTGKTNDSLIVNGTYVDKNTESCLIAQFSLSGSLQSYKLHDFLPQRNNIYNGSPGIQNMGIEICPGPGSDYYLFTDREGKHSDCCSSDTLNAPEEGRCVMRLNASFDTLWTTFIIGPGCYYGWDGHGLAAAANGDAYILSYCGGHYGGDGFIQRLDQNTGTISWNEDHMDGHFQDIFIEGNTVFTCGTDSATYCPCPSQYEGFQTVKNFDQTNTMTKLMKFDQSQYANSNLYFQSITRDNFGNTYIYGTFGKDSLVFGQDTVRDDPGLNTSFNGRVLIKLSDTSFSTSSSPKIIASSFNIYPNPSVTGSFEVALTGIRDGTINVSIYDVSGRKVYAELIPNTGEEFKKVIDLGKHAKGLYLAEISNSEGKRYKRVILE